MVATGVIHILIFSFLLLYLSFYLNYQIYKIINFTIKNKQWKHLGQMMLKINQVCFAKLNPSIS